MKALLLAATSSLALTGFAMAQTAMPDTTTAPMGTTTAPVTDAATPLNAPAATVGERVEYGADAPGDVVDPAVTPGMDAAATTTTMPADMTTTTGGLPGTATDPVVTTPVATDMTTTTGAAVPVTTDTAMTMTADHPAMLGSWIMNRRIWTTNQPSSTVWENTTLTERPADWNDIAKVNDLVVDAQGRIVGYVADIGGFLGLGAKSVLLSPDVLHFVQIGDDAFFATNYTRDELEALPDFDNDTVLH